VVVAAVAVAVAVAEVVVEVVEVVAAAGVVAEAEEAAAVGAEATAAGVAEVEVAAGAPATGVLGAADLAAIFRLLTAAVVETANPAMEIYREAVRARSIPRATISRCLPLIQRPATMPRVT
jgi:hypothetical protein